jgi:cell volume regulation protein A
MAVQILFLGVFYFLSRGFSIVFARYRIPDVLLLSCLGMILGPIGGFVSAEDLGAVGQVLTTVALVVILFEGGLGTSIPQLIESLGSSAKLTLGGFISTLVLSALIMFLLSRATFIGLQPWNVTEALLFGSIVAGTSSAVVIPLLSYLRVGGLMNSALTLESAVTDVLCIIFTVAMLQIVSSSDGLHVGPLVGQALSALIFAAVIGFAGGIFWIWVWKKLVHMKNEILTTVAFALFIFGITEFLGFSGGVAALAFGLTLNNYNLLPQRWISRIGADLPSVTEPERALFRELVFILKTFFFIYLGMQIPLDSWQPHLIALAVVTVVYLARHLLCRWALKPTELVSRRDISLASLMAPKGLAAAVLATIPGQLGLSIGTTLEPIVFAVVIQSILLTSILVWLSERTKQRVSP